MTKCSNCGLPEDRTHLCDRWDCPQTPIKEFPYKISEGTLILENVRKKIETSFGKERGFV